MPAHFLQTERAFVEHAAPLVVEQVRPSSGRWRMAREVGAGGSIADLVILFEPEPVSLVQDALTAAESVIVASLRRIGATRIDLLEERCGLERSELRVGALDRLLEWGLLLQQQGGRIALAEGWNHRVQIVAIEAKMNRWRQALEQAANYRRYADLAYVLLPESAAPPALRNKTVFEDSGVGLLIGQASSVTTAFPASMTSDHDWRREFVYSRLLKEEDPSSVG